MPRPSAAAVALAALSVALIGVTAAGCRAVGVSARPLGRPSATPCTRVSTPSGAAARPSRTEAPWRAEYLPDGSVRMAIGDVEAAPHDPAALRTTDYRAPDDASDCYRVRIPPVRGWWCVTTVPPLTESGRITVGGAVSDARLRAAGFRTRCSGHAPRIRQLYQVQRSSWSGWRGYTGWSATPWSGARTQVGRPVSVPCPRGRVGTYAYRLAVGVAVEGLRADPVDATGPALRSHCGTGAS